jgi:hypothetical protein
MSPAWTMRVVTEKLSGNVYCSEQTVKVKISRRLLSLRHKPHQNIDKECYEDIYEVTLWNFSIEQLTDRTIERE